MLTEQTYDTTQRDFGNYFTAIEYIQDRDVYYKHTIV